ncbi:N-acetylglucosamine-1-phosphotransferase subunits alpha/beta [Photinus pyralis]|uniref:EF-hand domain-containing protein n=2 Tax=Photinus pyralis TaxID=7054 RepID=A0A1Y1MHL6_PHOPY|nr:N-acetylglucosamine-1-phosphotransferase subunits alpha/beta [Photinus pyralis]
MVVKCRICNLILKHKLKVIIIFVFTLAFVNILQVFFFQLCWDNTSKRADELVDVVYTWVNGSDPRFLANLRAFLRTDVSTTTQDYSSQRFDDKYELKFSLRSLEKYAPWVNHVYIVTNGQIPYWLNLDYEKVTVVSHEEIFADGDDLPSFSSPAIESHLHRIPGLTDRFVYFNDDIFLGKTVYLDDFDSSSRGFVVYLAWPLPMCSVDCPWVYVGDGQCDTSCYNSNCQMDGGDCDGYHGQSLWNGSHYWDKSEIIRYQRNFSDTKSNQRALYQNVSVSGRLGLVSVPTRISRLFMRNATNVTRLVAEHNKQVILQNKLTRRKREQRATAKPQSAAFDAYGASLQHTNRVLNLKYGFRSRYAPAHSPIMIDRRIMEGLQATFPKQFLKTSRNRFRSDDDMQYAFSYYYYVMNEKQYADVGEIFDRFDTDGSGTWSDREIRTLLTKLYDLPLSYGTVDHFEELLLNCSRQLETVEMPTPEFERYVDSKLPTVSRDLIIQCGALSEVLKVKFGTRRKYKYETINNAQSSRVTFKMLNSNISEVVGHLDEIRRGTKKFVCLNDNMDETKYSENELIRAVLYDFYLSLFPKPSRFELPSDFRNRFLYLDELSRWKTYHFKLKLCTYLCIGVLCYLTYCNLLKRRFLYRLFNKLFY